MQEKQETLLDTINNLKSDVDKGKEKSTQQKAQIRNLQQVWFCFLFRSVVPFDRSFVWVYSRAFVRSFVRSLFRAFGCSFVRAWVLASVPCAFFRLFFVSYRSFLFLLQELNETSKKLVQTETSLEMQTKVH